MKPQQIEVQPVLLTFTDGHVEVMQFVLDDGRSGWQREATDFNIRHEIARTFEGREKPTGWRRIKFSDLPPDPDRGTENGITFRDAWVDRDGKVIVDMAKAKEVARERLRRFRAAPLAALDVQYQRADEAGDGSVKQQVAREKQTLRDLPAHPSIDAAGTPDELKAALRELEAR